ncbi:hypothetical protein [Iodobacter fluviatilis]|uniref:Uncharacterized protein n=1 Tax=Iodobacter fluviatilis TaxID=537 RepID=A0A7G3G4D4_9NEIS|nr:hypothetical protein [Iodobacter fluviatilis]QBC42107.1 hypothetical protein C1H71_00060 [Iodobacter fluviatilis]QBC45579.1 hypothetical protein C1H71_19995 [Iodobacter fluviatilis]
MDFLIAVITLIALLIFALGAVISIFLYEEFSIENQHLYFEYPHWQAPFVFAFLFVRHLHAFFFENIPLYLACKFRH